MQMLVLVSQFERLFQLSAPLQCQSNYQRIKKITPRLQTNIITNESLQSIVERKRGQRCIYFGAARNKRMNTVVR